MKRRDFVKNISLASLATPFVVKGVNFQALGNPLFSIEKNAEDKVLVIIRLGGGNDGLNTVIPLDQYANLQIQRPNIIIPEPSIIKLNSTIGLHPSMTGMSNMFQDGKLSIIQNVGYPDQNRSHFRSTDIWNSGLLADQSASTGWIGRNFDAQYPNFPSNYPNSDFPDPFAISIGSQVSATCQGLMGNFSHCVDNPNDTFSLSPNPVVNDGSYYGSHMDYLNLIINQTNAYGARINTAITGVSDSNLSIFDSSNQLALQLRYVLKMIKGGLKSKVYVLNVDGFDTHDSQVEKTDVMSGNHATLLKTLSDAIKVFQDDLAIVGIEQRVAGLTYSEFGRQVASNASLGTDHGDAAPLFLFGACVGTSVLGANPVIKNQIVEQEGVEMKIDFRDVYASILKNWFEVPANEVQALFEHQVTFYSILNGCNVGLDENGIENISSILLFPNPVSSYSTLRFSCDSEWVKIKIISVEGRDIATIFDGSLVKDTHFIKFEVSDFNPGEYLIQVLKESGIETVKMLKVKNL